MKNVLKIDHKNGKIIMDREFSIRASIFGTDEYNRLQQARRDYDQYGVERKTIKRNPKKEAFKGLTYAYMEAYMDRYNVSEEIRQEYQDVRFNVQCHSIRYPLVKQWFLKTFPEIKNLGTINEECNAADAAVSA
jgi:hypothetical protein